MFEKASRLYFLKNYNNFFKYLKLSIAFDKLPYFEIWFIEITGRSSFLITHLEHILD